MISALPGCFGRTTLDVGSNDAGHGTSGLTQPTPDGGLSPATIPTDHGPPYDAAEVAGAMATCSAPHGPLDKPATLGDLATKIVGSWYLCSTSAPGEDTVKSMELDADGNWYNLLDDGQGGLIRGQGVDDQGTYQPTDSNDDPDAGADAPTTGFVPRYRGAGMFPDFVSFEKDPRRMNIEEGTSGFEEWFVYVGPTTP